LSDRQSGRRWQKPLAVVVVTGMMLAPLVILVTLPVLISFLLAPRALTFGLARGFVGICP